MPPLPDQQFNPEQALLALRSFAGHLVWIRLAVVEKPTPAQLKAVQTHFPRENLLTVRRRLIEGTARIGPFLPETVQDFARIAFETVNLSWREEATTDDDLTRMDLGDSRS